MRDGASTLVPVSRVSAPPGTAKPGAACLPAPLAILSRKLGVADTDVAAFSAGLLRYKKTIVF